MNDQPKSKVLIIIIGSLLIANIVLIAFLLMNYKQKEKRDRGDKNAYVVDYLQNEVGFTKEQLGKYDSLSKYHREQVKSIFKEISENRKIILLNLASADFSDSAINSAANSIHERQRTLELNMLKHLKEIRDICTKEQRQRFDTGFYKIFGRRGETYKRK
jgi:hypothetical protein